MLERALAVVIVLFPLSELALAAVRRSRIRDARSEDRGSMRLLWLTIGLGVTLAVAA
jgi:CBS domain containing-hemolysin-like protein